VFRIDRDEANAILLPKSPPSRSCTSDIIGVSTGQVAVQRVKMKVTATTLPRNLASETCAPSCEISVKSGAGAISGSGCASEVSGAVRGDSSINIIAAAGRPNTVIASARMSGVRMLIPSARA
jgi:hypothetical protein